MLGRTGPEHCRWESAVFLHVAWPLGSPQSTLGDGDSRTYLRDPGYASKDVALWLGPDEGGEYVYLVRGEAVERWPRATDLPGCA